MSKKKTFFNYKIKIKIKTAPAALKNELKYSPVSEGNICKAEPNLEVYITLKVIQ